MRHWKGLKLRERIAKYYWPWCPCCLCCASFEELVPCDPALVCVLIEAKFLRAERGIMRFGDICEFRSELATVFSSVVSSYSILHLC